MKIEIKIKTSGVKEFSRNMNKISKGVLPTGKAAIKKVAQGVYEEAYKEVPRDTGALANTLYRDTYMEKSKVVSNIGHGGAFNQMNPVTGLSAESYAVERHEKISGNYSSKWLELAFRNAEAEFDSTVGDSFKNYFETLQVPVDELEDRENRQEPLNIEGSKAYAYKMKQEQSKKIRGRWVSLATSDG